MTESIDRRDLLRGVAALAVSPWLAAPAFASQAATRLVLLGTAGGPRPHVSHASSAQAVVLADGTTYVVDCGNGVAGQLVRAGIPLTSLRHVLLTHHHSDHNADYGNLLWLAWASGLHTAVDTWGPPPLERMTELFLEMNAVDINTRIADEGRVALAPLIRPHDVRAPGVVFQDERMKVTAALVDHPPLVPAFAYRFDAPDRSIVISGDTARSDSLVRLASGADVLVHEALFPSAVDRIVAQVPNASTLKAHLLASHTSAEDCGRVAQAAGVKTLVLSHLVPVEDPAVTDDMWVEAARAHFGGTIVVGRDLMTI
jgi:ribonuclease BN (tRNA processing enzyme)